MRAPQMRAADGEPLPRAPSIRALAASHLALALPSRGGPRQRRGTRSTPPAEATSDGAGRAAGPAVQRGVDKEQQSVEEIAEEHAA